ncbi:MAG: Asp23/Gls24 family envelope stress response protein [Oscillospiraceae bacterium]
MEINEKKQQGTLKISEDVIATVAKLATQDIEGVNAVSAPPANVREIIKRPKSLMNPIDVVLSNDVAEITVNVELKKGYKVVPVSETIQKNVKEAVQSMTGIAVSKVNVRVNSVAFPAEA